MDGGGPSIRRTKKVLAKLVNGKSPGKSQVPPYALKALDTEHQAKLLDFLVKFWRGETDYKEWHRALLCCLQKPGKKTTKKLNSWRGICLNDLPSKVLSLIISSQLQKHLEVVGI